MPPITMSTDYYNGVIDTNDLDIVEFYQTFGANVTNEGTHGVYDLDSAVSAPPVTDLRLADQAAIMGVTEEELAQMLALAPDVSELEIAQILAMTPQMIQDPDLYFPKEDHPWGNLPYTPSQASASSASVKPNMTLGIKPSHESQSQLEVSCIPYTEQHASERAKRAQNRSLLRDISRKCLREIEKCKERQRLVSTERYGLRH